MRNSHRYDTRGTTVISCTIGELAARLLKNRTMTNKDLESNDGDAAPKAGTEPIGSTANGSLEQGQRLQMEVEYLRQEMAKLKSSHNSFSIDQNAMPMHVVVNSDPLQQMKEFVKPFHGRDQDDVHKWLESITHYFSVTRLPGVQEQLYLQYAPAFLKDIAYKWWKENKQEDWSWQTFKQALICQFGNKNEHLLARQLDQRRQQYNEPVIQYYYDILELCNKYDPDMSDKQKVFKLINGLRWSLYTEAVKDVYTNPAEFLSKVQQVENVQRIIELRQAQLTNPSDEMPRQQTPWYPTNRNQYAQQYDHNQQPTRNSKRYVPPRQTNRSIECYKCRQPGHIARHCPQQASATNDLEQRTNQKNQ